MFHTNQSDEPAFNKKVTGKRLRLIESTTVTDDNVTNTMTSTVTDNTQKKHKNTSQRTKPTTGNPAHEAFRRNPRRNQHSFRTAADSMYFTSNSREPFYSPRF